MKLYLISEHNLTKPPTSIIKVKEYIFCSMKSDKLYDVMNNKYIKLSSSVEDIACESDNIICLSKRHYYKFNVDTSKISQNNFSLDVSAFKFNENEKKYICGLKDGRVILTDNHFRPIKTFYGITNRIVDINCDLKNKIVCSCLIDCYFYLFNIKTMALKKIKISKGNVSALDIYNKRYVIVGLDNGSMYIYDIEKDKIVHEHSIEGSISCIKIINNHVIIGTLQKEILVCHLIQDKKDINVFSLVTLEMHILDGIINCIYNFCNKIYIGTGREEKVGSFNKKIENKNKIYTFSSK